MFKKNLVLSSPAMVVITIAFCFAAIAGSVHGGKYRGMEPGATKKADPLCFTQKNTALIGDPGDLVAADFDADGIQDFAITDRTHRRLRVFLGGGNGTFNLDASYPVDVSLSLVASDWNGDGATDLAVLNRDILTISVFLNNSSGKFTLASTISLAAGETPLQIVAAKVDAGNYSDLVLLRGGNGDNVSFFSGVGDGTFGTAASFAFLQSSRELTIADMNGDSRADLLGVSPGNNRLGVAFGNGNGTFGTVTEYTTAVNPYSLAANDINGDGFVDVAVASRASKVVRVFSGSASGTLTRISDHQTPELPNKVRIADINDDGHHDIISLMDRSNAEGFSVLLGNGDLTFKPGFAFGAIQGGLTFEVGRLDSDGKSDILMLDAANIYKAFLSNCGACSNPSFKELQGSPFTAGQQPVSVVVGDFLRDTRTDFAVLNRRSSTINIFLGDGSGGFRTSGQTLSVNIDPISLHTGNVDSGQQDDLIVGGSFSRAAVFIGRANGQFNSVQYSSVGQHNKIAVADFNGDNLADLAATGGRGRALGFMGKVSVFLGAGNGTFNRRIINWLLKEPFTIKAADFNGDSNQDVAVRGFILRELIIMLGDGAGQFTSTKITVPAGLFIEAADFNSDQHIDLLLETPNGYGVMLGRGDGTFLGVVDNTISKGPLVISDFNFDKKPDIAVANGGSNSVSIYMGDGNGNLTKSGRDLAVGTSPAALATADVDGSGFPDLVVANSGSNNVTVLLNKCGLNTAPTINALSLDRTQGDTPQRIKIGEVADKEEPANRLTVTVNGGASATVNGVRVSDITVAGSGDVSALIGVSKTASTAGFDLQVSDSEGLSATARMTVNVAANPPPTVTLTGPSVGAFFLVGSTIPYLGSFEDNPGDTHTATFTLTGVRRRVDIPAVVDETNGTVSARHTFSTPGVYKVGLTVTDSLGQTGSATEIDGREAYIVVHAIVRSTANGKRCWFDAQFLSPAEADRRNPESEGKAKIKFKSKYKTNDTTPSGFAKFEFKTGDLKFKSTVLNWLVFEGKQAFIGGSGRINGSGIFGFVVVAFDGKPSTQADDTIRLIIYDPVSLEVIYDNQVSGDKSILARPNTTLQKGKITVKQK